MPRKISSSPEPEHFPLVAQETLYVGVDIGKRTHVGGFLSTTLLARHQRFEHCPALSFENSREGFRSLIDRIKTYVPLTQVQVLLEVTGHYHRALMQYLQDLDIPVYIIHVQKRREGLLKSDKRDALGLANQLYNQLEKGIQVDDPLQAVRRLAPPTEAAAQLRGMVHHHAELVSESTMAAKTSSPRSAMNSFRSLLACCATPTCRQPWLCVPSSRLQPNSPRPRSGNYAKPEGKPVVSPMPN